MLGSAASGTPASRIPRRALSATVGPAPWFVPIAATSSAASRLAATAAPTPPVTSASSSNVSSATIGERGDAAYRLDRDDELLEVEEGLDHEQVDAASLEHLRLRRVLRAVLGRVEHLELAERADRPGDEDVAPGDLARLAREPDGGGVDLLERLVEEDAGELAAVRPERVRLDQLGPGGDVARVDGDDALGRAEVRLLRAAQAGHGLRDQRPRPAVGHDRARRCRVVRGTGSRFDCSPGSPRGSGEAGLPPGPAPTRPVSDAGAGPPRARAASGERSGHRRRRRVGVSPLRGTWLECLLP